MPTIAASATACFPARIRTARGQGKEETGRISARPAALVTGAHRGMGRAIGVHLARCGYDILCADHRAEGAEETARLVRQEGGPGVIRTDVNASVRDAYTGQIEARTIPPIRRWEETENVGETVAGLVSGDIPFSTGSAFYVDGGLHILRF